MATAVRRSARAGEWGAAGESGALGAPEPLFPRLETESTEPSADPRPPSHVRLIDSHCHLNAERFAGEEAAVLERARAAGVER